jgi:hypothetical protein
VVGTVTLVYDHHSVAQREAAESSTTSITPSSTLHVHLDRQLPGSAGGSRPGGGCQKISMS